MYLGTLLRPPLLVAENKTSAGALLSFPNVYKNYVPGISWSLKGLFSQNKNFRRTFVEFPFIENY